MKAVRREKQTHDETSFSPDNVLPRAMPNCTSHTTNIIPSTVQGTCARLGRWKNVGLSIGCDTSVVEDPPSGSGSCRGRSATPAGAAALAYGVTCDILWLLTSLPLMLVISIIEEPDGTGNMAMMKDLVSSTLLFESAQRTVPLVGMLGAETQPQVALNGENVCEVVGLGSSAAAAEIRSSVRRMHHCALQTVQDMT